MKGERVNFADSFVAPGTAKRSIEISAAHSNRHSGLHPESRGIRWR